MDNRFYTPNELFTNPPKAGAPDALTGLERLKGNQRALLELVGALPTERNVILDGGISPTSARIAVDTEGDAPADDLTTIVSDFHDGGMILVKSFDPARVITIRNNPSVNGILTGGPDIVLDTKYYATLFKDGDRWFYEPIVRPMDLSDAVNSNSSIIGASSKAVKTAYDKAEEALDRSSLPMGLIYPYAFSDVPAGGLRLDGQTVANCKKAFPEFYAKALVTSNRCTMAEYTTKLSASDGQCGFFGVDEVTGNVRLPRITQFLAGVLTMDDLGKAELDQGRNVTGRFPYYANTSWDWSNTGLAYATDYYNAGATISINATSFNNLILDAARNWGAEHTGPRFQPANVRFPYIIQVYSSAIPASVAQAAEFINLLKGKVDNNLTGVLAGAGSNLNTAGIRTVVSVWHSGDNWFRKWSDGWIEQGGAVPKGIESPLYTINVNGPFTTNTYGVLITFNDVSHGAGPFSREYLFASSKTVSSFKIGYVATGSAGLRQYWEARGY